MKVSKTKVTKKGLYFALVIFLSQQIFFDAYTWLCTIYRQADWLVTSQNDHFEIQKCTLKSKCDILDN